LKSIDRVAYRWAALCTKAARTLAAATLACAGISALAHDFKAGALVIDHPYATPTPPSARTGAVYFRTLKNTGREADRLLGARTPAAASVEIHRSTMDGDVMRMRQIDALALPAGAEIKVRHGGELHLMLVDLKAPLKEGERFPIWLRFERAGEREVMVWVQQPRDSGAAPAHKH
jgi:copper(I)-binding protein